MSETLYIIHEDKSIPIFLVPVSRKNIYTYLGTILYIVISILKYFLTDFFNFIKTCVTNTTKWRSYNGYHNFVKIIFKFELRYLSALPVERKISSLHSLLWNKTVSKNGCHGYDSKIHKIVRFNFWEYNEYEKPLYFHYS